ncbi:TRAP transporter small permease [Anaeroselena agilis]|uniref:TRAP transporter small permease n=1 Tax=Anaeroselena agilis TaxID=3063788 RepID=A0ABU3NVY2_9FIRM|nr:TRAP transporter small permease [Selenomonadales bacterium 4137-cl]
MEALKNLDKILGCLLRGGSVALLAAIFVILIANVFVRFFPVTSFGWFDEIIEMLIAWFVFLGAAALWRENEHFVVSFLPDHLKGKTAGHLLDIVVSIVSLAFLAIFTYYSLNLTMRAQDWTPIINMPKKLLYASMPFSGALMIVYSVRNIIRSGGRLVGRQR